MVSDAGTGTDSRGSGVAFRIETGDASVVYRGVESVRAVCRADVGVNSGTGQGRRVEPVSAVEVHVAQSGEM